MKLGAENLAISKEGAKQMPEKPLPNYEVVPLRSDVTRVGVIQGRNKTADPSNPDLGKKENIEHMCWLIDHAQQYGVRPEMMKDLIVFHESPVQGWDGLFTREEQYALAIDANGWEVEKLGEKAKEYNCYIIFGSTYTRHEGWPGHYANTGFLINPEGKIILKAWKTDNLPGMGWSSTIYDILDKFLEMYGWEAVFPVARTDIGNIAIFPATREPEIARAFAIKGTEILVRYMTNGRPFRFEVPALCYANRFYGVFVNQAVYEGDRRPADTDGGGTAVFDDTGKMIAEATSLHETIVSVNIPIATFRKTHSIPVVRKALFECVWAEYECKYPPNSYLDHLPKSKMDALEQLRKIARW